MSNPEPTICINVDLYNPGQFFACCGLFELADRAWPEAEAWFEAFPMTSKFCIRTPNNDGSLKALLEVARTCVFDIGDKNEDTTDADRETAVGPVHPIVISSPIKMVLDWWSDRSIKPWAGSMSERLIFRAMLRAIPIETLDPLNFEQAVRDPSSNGESKNKKGRKGKQKKREPFYFDCRRGSKSHPLDSGWSPDTHNMEHQSFPAVEALCFLGLQRCRPMPMEKPNTSRYTVWLEHLPLSVIAPVVSGLMSVPRSVTYEFTNFFRTGERKHKAFGEAKCSADQSRAMRERSQYG